MQNMVDEIELTIIIYRVYGIQKVCITTKYLLTKIDLVIEIAYMTESVDKDIFI